ncbi:site-specific DNA-methyltransferase [Thermosipho atlanticus]|uniref:Adenine-specific DNA-methyltransferase n=1 Tax=Thermosipho atlanticus DSM 15807 TaxID=1123380 RepID=A0A1M5RC36_9BACT|nr:site-specific DNA-methyltransferase [Thermosipho atlanticus]SHH23914.1 adenine-specific DNA-methyltransferase [Thermosipho atlanticus DSM 15807]
MESEKLKEKLREKLRELFRFESEDLDFGIYRLTNYKRREIENFINKDLIEEIQKQLQLLGEEESQKIKEEFEKTKQEIKITLGEDAFENGELNENFKNTPLAKKYYEKKKQLENMEISEDLERQIYNHIINFFSRYYDKGDFISKRRYGKNEKYVVPYNGEEVLLYWTNKDQYYIKTTEYFRKYTFKVKGLTVNFKVVEAEEEKANIKSQEKKFFVLNEKIFDFDEKNKKLNIYFEYRTLNNEETEKYKQGQTVSQDRINEEIVRILDNKTQQNILTRLIFEREGEKTLIEKHLYRYTRRNTTDYFIHKDLKGFLERELDFYIKNEFLQLEDLQVLEESGYFDKLRLYLIGVRAFRNIALKIIEFLAQIENFQKKLWEKKKFVIDTHYVITLDKIKEYAGEEFLESILDEILNNEKQLKEWKELFGIDIKGKDDLILNNGQLQLNGKEWKKLPIDTKYFDEEFKWKLLVSLSKNNDLDEILDGVLIKSENFHALNLLLNKYYEKVQTIYIDPPFNTKTSEILYKNGYKHSTWLTLMENRIYLARKFISENGIFISAIDETEVRYLMNLCDQIFNKKNRIGTIIVLANPQGRVDRKLSLTSEYNLIYAKNIEKTPDLGISKEGKWTNLKRTGTNSRREDRPLRFYPILLKEGKIFMITDEEYSKIYDKEKKQFNDDFLKTIVDKYSKQGYDVILPMSNSGEYLVWQREFERVKREKDFYKIINGNIYTPPINVKTPKTIWIDPKYSNPEYGTESLKHLIWNKNIDVSKNTPKSVFTVSDFCNLIPSNYILDFFAGSGTTAHAIMKLNKEDGGKRKFILVEMADYFDTVIIPRIKKVAYSFNWKEGKPQDTDGIGIFFKYHTLEQYEDALENIEFEEAQETLYEFSDYFVKYMFEWETKSSKTFLNIDDMKDPFNYKLKIIENYQPKTVNVDLVETFNYLLGLHVKGYKVLEENGRKYVFIFGKCKSQHKNV